MDIFPLYEICSFAWRLSAKNNAIEKGMTLKQSLNKLEISSVIIDWVYPSLVERTNYRIVFISFAAWMHFASAVVASCYNNDDGLLLAREFEICLEQECFTDVLEYECANADWSGAGFASGFTVSCASEVEGQAYTTTTTQSDCSFKIGYFEMPHELRENITCKAKSANDIGCIWYGLLLQRH